VNRPRFHQPSNGATPLKPGATLRGLEPRPAARPWRLPYHPPRKTVLVVDDEPCLLDLYREILRETLRARVFAVPDSAEALRLLLRSPPDLIISDIARPQLDGLEFTRRVRRWRLEVPVLIISGALCEPLAAAARAAGATACMAKPFAVHDFVRLVRRLLVRRARLGVWTTCATVTPMPSGRTSPRPPTDRG
jgi:CheY-like chemotaxis protein